MTHPSGKPTSFWSLAELKHYIREKRLNKPELKMNMRKAQLQAGLKKHGHWRDAMDSEKPKRVRVAGKGKKLGKKKTKADFEKARKGLGNILKGGGPTGGVTKGVGKKAKTTY